MDSSLSEKLELIVPSLEYESELQRFRQEFIDNGGQMHGCGSFVRKPLVADWIKEIEMLSSQQTCPASLVPMSQFVYYRQADKKIVGAIQIRHYLNDFLAKYGGHIGYSVAPSERRKGYATKMLREVLPVCRELGLDKIMITCLKDNQASSKTILNNGGIYQDCIYMKKGDIYFNRYWINLSFKEKGNK